MIANFFKDAINQLQRGENAYKIGNVKSMVFDREVSINVDNDTILDVSCTCPRGLVKCHHIAALCIYGHHNVSVTDQACRWSAPRQGNVVGYSWLLRPESEVDVEDILPSVENLVFSKEYLEASDRDLFLREKLCLTQNKVKEVVNKTIGQAKNENWLIARKNRLTATIQWGKEHQNVALNTFSDAFDNMDIIPTGLWLDESGFLGASPDGLCGDSLLLLKWSVHTSLEPLA
ncbi:hypothetical protein JTB14_035102 [Gonioctena quinquepunctata]|nr:hypothetical protein JTB14_035102 [Gonioctena quinquepunctata]